MKIERKKNAVRNIFTGVILRLLQTIVPFLLRSVMIFRIGIEYVGLDSLFTSILHVLNLVEMGVGSAMIYSMYKPIAMDEECKICSLLNLYRKYYRIIGAVILLVGLGVIPILRKLISGDVPPNVNIYYLYLINLCATVLSYWLFAYKNSLLIAHQRNDIINVINIISYGVRYGGQFVALLLFKNIYLYFVALLFSQLLANVITVCVTNVHFPQYKPKGDLNKGEKESINRRIKDIFIAKLGGTITNSADTLVISAFLGLEILAKYNNYYCVLVAVIGFVTIVLQSCLGGIGNSLVVDAPEKKYKNFEVFSMMLTWIIGYCTAGIFCLIQPFMVLWVKEKNVLNEEFVVLLAIYFCVLETGVIWSTYKDAGGIWHKDRYRPLVVTIVNLCLNLIMVNYWGLYGVVLSTVISYVVVGMPWIIYNLFSTLFCRNATSYVLKVFYGFLTTFIACVVSKFACGFINVEGVWGIVYKGLIVTLVSNMVFWGMFFKREEFDAMKIMLYGMICKVKK